MLACLQLLRMFVANLFRPRRQLEVENLFLRHQLNIALRGAPHRPRLRGSDMALLILMTWLWPSLLSLSRIVQPNTILRWHRAGFRTYWRVAGIGRGAVERAILPIRQHQARIQKAALPRPAGDRGKSLFRHRQIDDPGEVKAVGWRLRARVLRRRKRRQARHGKSQQPCLCLVSASRSGYFFWQDFMHMSYSVLHVFAE
jgi:hypothetical protein